MGKVGEKREKGQNEIQIILDQITNHLDLEKYFRILHSYPFS